MEREVTPLLARGLELWIDSFFLVFLRGRYVVTRGGAGGDKSGPLGYKNDEALILGFVSIGVGFTGNIAAMVSGMLRWSEKV